MCVPAAKELVLKEARLKPPELLTLTGLPKGLPSIRTCTAPVGVPAPGPATLMAAVKTTTWPTTAEGTEEVTATVVAVLTGVVIVSPPVRLPVLAAKFTSPL